MTGPYISLEKALDNQFKHNSCAEEEKLISIERTSLKVSIQRFLYSLNTYPHELKHIFCKINRHNNFKADETIG